MSRDSLKQNGVAIIGNFTFMWQYIVTNFFLINSKRHTNFPNLFYQETLHVSGIYSAHHQEFSTVHSALVYVIQVWWQLSSTTRMELVPGRSWKLAPNLHDIYQCRMYSGKVLMMELVPVPSWSCSKAVIKLSWRIPGPNIQWKTPDNGQRNCPKHVDFLEKKIWEISASVCFIKKKFFTVHGHMNVKLVILAVTPCGQ